MKTRRLLILPLILALGACAPTQTLEELEFQALQTGDWSAVERRERAMARRAETAMLECPHGMISYCEDRIGETTCQCVSRRALDEFFGQSF